MNWDIVDGVLVTQFQDYIHKDLNFTQGHDQYTGRQLWRRPNSMTDTIAQPGSLFQRFLEVIVQIDPWTGKEIRRYLPPFEGGHWSAMAAESDGSRFYLRCSGKKDEKDWAFIMAVDPVTGKPLWNLGGPDQPEQWPAWNAIADGRLYFLRGNAEGARRAEAMTEMKALLQNMPGKDYREFEAKLEEHTYQVLQAVDAATGKPLWTYETEGGAEILSSVNFSGPSLLVGSYDGFLYCLDCKTGKLLWKVETGAPVHCSPAISEGKTFVAGCDGLLRVIDVKTGKEVSQLELGENTAASPAVDGNQLYVGTYGSQIKGVDWKAGKILWSYQHPVRRFPYYASVALGKKLVVAGGRDKLIHGIDRATGKSVWTFQTRSRVESSPVIAGTRILCGSSDKNIYMLELATGKKVWTFEGDGSFVASPALADGRMVIGCDSGLVYCFDLNPAKK